MSDIAEKKSQFNLNTILMFVMMTGIAWMANETVQNGKKLASIESTQPFRNEAASRLEKKVDELSTELARQRETIGELRYQLADAGLLKRKTVN